MLRVLLAIEDYGELLYLQTLLKKLGFDVGGVQNERQVEEGILTLNPEVIVATAKGKRINGIGLAETVNKNRGIPKILLLALPAQMAKLKGLKIANVDGLLESPVRPHHMLTQLAEVGNLDREQLLEKYRKLKMSLSPDQAGDQQILTRDTEDSADGSNATPSSGPQSTVRPPVDRGGESRDEDEEELELARESGAGGESAEAEDPSESVKLGQVNLEPSSLSQDERRARFERVLSQLEKPTDHNFSRQRVMEFHREIRSEENPEDIADLEAERQEFVKKLFKK